MPVTLERPSLREAPAKQHEALREAPPKRSDAPMRPRPPEELRRELEVAAPKRPVRWIRWTLAAGATVAVAGLTFMVFGNQDDAPAIDTGSTETYTILREAQSTLTTVPEIVYTGPSEMTVARQMSITEPVSEIFIPGTGSVGAEPVDRAFIPGFAPDAVEPVSVTFIPGIGSYEAGPFDGPDPVSVTFIPGHGSQTPTPVEVIFVSGTGSDHPEPVNVTFIPGNG